MTRGRRSALVKSEGPKPEGMLPAVERCVGPGEGRGRSKEVRVDAVFSPSSASASPGTQKPAPLSVDPTPSSNLKMTGRTVDAQITPGRCEGSLELLVCDFQKWGDT